MKINSISIIYICPICKTRREFYMFKSNFNMDDLCAGHKGCMTCAAENIVSILDILTIECKVEV